MEKKRPNKIDKDFEVIHNNDDVSPNYFENFDDDEDTPEKPKAKKSTMNAFKSFFKLSKKEQNELK